MGLCEAGAIGTEGTGLKLYEFWSKDISAAIKDIIGHYISLR